MRPSALLEHTISQLDIPRLPPPAQRSQPHIFRHLREVLIQELRKERELKVHIAPAVVYELYHDLPFGSFVRPDRCPSEPCEWCQPEYQQILARRIVFYEFLKPSYPDWKRHRASFLDTCGNEENLRAEFERLIAPKEVFKLLDHFEGFASQLGFVSMVSPYTERNYTAREMSLLDSLLAEEPIGLTRVGPMYHPAASTYILFAD